MNAEFIGGLIRTVLGQKSLDAVNLMLEQAKDAAPKIEQGIKDIHATLEAIQAEQMEQRSMLSNALGFNKNHVAPCGEGEETNAEAHEKSSLSLVK